MLYENLTPQVQVDVSFGNEAERRMEAILKRCFDGEVTKTPPGHAFDFLCTSNKTNQWIELKSRRVAKDKYATTLIGKCKTDHARNLTASGEKVIFCFRFVDGTVHYINYSAKLFDTFDVKMQARWDRGETIPKPHLLIPTNLLKFMCTM